MTYETASKRCCSVRLYVTLPNISHWQSNVCSFERVITICSVSSFSAGDGIAKTPLAMKGRAPAKICCTCVFSMRWRNYGVYKHTPAGCIASGKPIFRFFGAFGLNQGQAALQHACLFLFGPLVLFFHIAAVIVPVLFLFIFLLLVCSIILGGVSIFSPFFVFSFFFNKSSI